MYDRMHPYGRQEGIAGTRNPQRTKINGIVLLQLIRPGPWSKMCHQRSPALPHQSTLYPLHAGVWLLCSRTLPDQLGLLQPGISSHTILFIATRQLEHAIVKRMEACQCHKLEDITHLAQALLEVCDCIGIELLAPVERWRAVVRQQLVRIALMDLVGEALRLTQIWLSRLTPDQVCIGSVR